MYSGDMWLSGLYAVLGLITVGLFILVIYWNRRAYYNINRPKQVVRRKVKMMTGSMGRDPVTDLLNNRPLGGVYLLGDGDVVPFLSAAPEDADEEEAMEYDMAQMAVRYVMYALERDDWKHEFAEWESTLEESLRANAEAVRRDRLKASLRVIPGGKAEEESTEDE